MKMFLAVALGGAVGSCMRYGASLWFLKTYPGFPWGTVLVNVIGSFVIGLIFPLLASANEAMRTLLVAGFLGGLTTMSGFSLETVTLITSGRPGAALANWASGALLCITVCWVGVFCGQLLGRSWS